MRIDTTLFLPVLLHMYLAPGILYGPALYGSVPTAATSILAIDFSSLSATVRKDLVDFCFTFEQMKDENKVHLAAENGRLKISTSVVHEIRSDVKIVATDLLMAIAPLRPLLLPVQNMTGTSRKKHIERITEALTGEQAVIIFPAGEVSRFGFQGINDGPWQRGFLKIAETAKAPILPIHIAGHNSVSFYVASILARPLSTIMLVGEMFRQERKRYIEETILECY